MNQPPPLKPLHSESYLIKLKLEQFRQISNEELINSLVPGKIGALKTQVDGTIMDGHHRIVILRERNVDVDTLPREIWQKMN